MKEIRTRIYTFTENLRKHVMPYDDDVGNWQNLNGVIYLGEAAKQRGFAPGEMVDIIIDDKEIIIRLVKK